MEKQLEFNRFPTELVLFERKAIKNGKNKKARFTLDFSTNKEWR